MRIIRRYETKDVTIAQSASLSGALNTEGTPVRGIIMPAAWTSAVLTFQAATTVGATYMDVYDGSGNEINLTAAASRAIGLTTSDRDSLEGFQYIKIRSGTSGSAVTQGAARTISFTLRT